MFACVRVCLREKERENKKILGVCVRVYGVFVLKREREREQKDKNGCVCVCCVLFFGLARQGKRERERCSIGFQNFENKKINDSWQFKGRRD